MKNKQLTDSQLLIILKTIELFIEDFEKNDFKSGYLQAMLNYGIISGEQYENIYK